jgi:hypothetical protein
VTVPVPPRESAALGQFDLRHDRCQLLALEKMHMGSSSLVDFIMSDEPQTEGSFRE